MELIMEKWNDILKQLVNEFDISAATVEAWQLANLKLHKIENRIVYFVVPDRLKKLINKYDDKFATAFLISIIEITNQNIEEVKFITSDDIHETEEADEPDTFITTPKKKAVLDSSVHANLNSKYTFDTYVVGDNNRLAYSSCLAVAESPGEQYNPLFLYGGPGLGKTHLMNAIAHYIIENIPDKKILFVDTNDLVNEIISTVRNTNKNNVVMSMDNLRDKYNNLDVLLIDDIQFIIGKEHTQEEFFHIFNRLYEKGKQIIISCDRPPKELKTLEQRLISRFNMGLITDISSPTYETRKAILEKKNQLEHYYLSNEILEYIAQNIATNVRELEGALKKLGAYSTLNNIKQVTLEEAKRELMFMISPNQPVDITPEFIISTVAEHFNVSTDDILSSNRSKTIALPRHICMYLCREILKITFKEIGKSLGGRDHSTCMNGYNKIDDSYLKDDSLRNTIDILTMKIDPNTSR